MHIIIKSFILPIIFVIIFIKSSEIDSIINQINSVYNTQENSILNIEPQNFILETVNTSINIIYSNNTLSFLKEIHLINANDNITIAKIINLNDIQINYDSNISCNFNLNKSDKLNGEYLVKTVFNNSSLDFIDYNNIIKIDRRFDYDEICIDDYMFRFIDIIPITNYSKINNLSIKFSNEFNISSQIYDNNTNTTINRLSIKVNNSQFINFEQEENNITINKSFIEEFINSNEEDEIIFIFHDNLNEYYDSYLTLKKFILLEKSDKYIIKQDDPFEFTTIPIKFNIKIDELHLIELVNYQNFSYINISIDDIKINKENVYYVNIYFNFSLNGDYKINFIYQNDYKIITDFYINICNRLRILSLKISNFTILNFQSKLVGYLPIENYTKLYIKLNQNLLYYKNRVSMLDNVNDKKLIFAIDHLSDVNSTMIYDMKIFEKDMSFSIFDSFDYEDYNITFELKILKINNVNLTSFTLKKNLTYISISYSQNDYSLDKIYLINKKNSNEIIEKNATKLKENNSYVFDLSLNDKLSGGNYYIKSSFENGGILFNDNVFALKIKVPKSRKLSNTVKIIIIIIVFIAFIASFILSNLFCGRKKEDDIENKNEENIKELETELNIKDK